MLQLTQVFKKNSKKFLLPDIFLDANLIEVCKLGNSTCVKQDKKVFNCYHLEPLTTAVLNESCVQGVSYDYFSNSEASYIATFTGIGALIVGINKYIKTGWSKTLEKFQHRTEIRISLYLNFLTENCRFCGSYIYTNQDKKTRNSNKKNKRY